MRRGNAGLGRRVSESRCARPPASREAPTTDVAAAAAVVVVLTATSLVPQVGAKVGLVCCQEWVQEPRNSSKTAKGTNEDHPTVFHQEKFQGVLSSLSLQTFGYEEIVQPVSLMGTDLRAQPGTSPNSQRPSRPWHDFARHTDSDKIQIPKIHTDDDKIHIPKL
ncbi:hypothetical protein Pmani_009969 [Petrolisthes manimaculis]|uniref:Uncharacterized protein n=1 Tax=Petrolisthes manimaculis TaxID=1843537 RepID=A0AAE1UG36_9EUCA|nr:hypothetical protein Pmani_009969 [Petrolisthes manimaculis]